VIATLTTEIADPLVSSGGVPETRRRLEDTILQRVARKDQAAVRECLDTYGGLVWSLARRFLRGDRADAEDAVQEIFVDLWKSAPRFDPSVSSETTFVAMIARRRLIDRVRRSSRRPTQEALVEEAVGSSNEPLPIDDQAEDVGAATRALADLSPEQQKAIRMSLINGLSHQQISDATGMPLGTVKTHIRRGVIRIREKLAAEGKGVVQ
jgi:RNA polymerase sigma factor (sigma-70 family)